MSSPAGIWCECGRRITIHHVLQHGFVMSQWVPQFVYIKYRCPRCHAIGRELLDFELWDSSVLDVPEMEPTPDEWERFGEMGDIPHDEMMEFARQLRTVSSAALDRLASDG